MSSFTPSDLVDPLDPELQGRLDMHPQPRLLKLKVECAGEVRRFSVLGGAGAWDRVRAKLAELFGFPSFSVTYRDSEGDNVVVDSDGELQTALGEGDDLLRLCVSPSGKGVQPLHHAPKQQQQPQPQPVSTPQDQAASSRLEGAKAAHSKAPEEDAIVALEPEADEPHQDDHDQDNHDSPAQGQGEAEVEVQGEAEAEAEGAGQQEAEAVVESHARAPTPTPPPRPMPANPFAVLSIVCEWMVPCFQPSDQATPLLSALLGSFVEALQDDTNMRYDVRGLLGVVRPHVSVLQSLASDPDFVQEVQLMLAQFPHYPSVHALGGLTDRFIGLLECTPSLPPSLVPALRACCRSAPPVPYDSAHFEPSAALSASVASSSLSLSSPLVVPGAARGEGVPWDYRPLPMEPDEGAEVPLFAGHDGSHCGSDHNAEGEGQGEGEGEGLSGGWQAPRRNKFEWPQYDDDDDEPLPAFGNHQDQHQEFQGQHQEFQGQHQEFQPQEFQDQRQEFQGQHQEFQPQEFQGQHQEFQDQNHVDGYVSPQLQHHQHDQQQEQLQHQQHESAHFAPHEHDHEQHDLDGAQQDAPLPLPMASPSIPPPSAPELHAHLPLSSGRASALYPSFEAPSPSPPPPVPSPSPRVDAVPVGDAHNAEVRSGQSKLVRWRVRNTGDAVCQRVALVPVDQNPLEAELDRDGNVVVHGYPLRPGDEEEMSLVLRAPPVLSPQPENLTALFQPYDPSTRTKLGDLWSVSFTVTPDMQAVEENLVQQLADMGFTGGRVLEMLRDHNHNADLVAAMLLNNNQ